MGSTQQEELLQAAEESCRYILDLLVESNVPGEHIEKLRKLLSEHETEEIMYQAEDIGYCMPYMKHEDLIRRLTAAWQNTAAYKQLLRKKAFRSCMRLEADSKADQEEVEEARRKRDDIDRSCAVANLKLYKMQVIVRSYDDETKQESIRGKTDKIKESKEENEDDGQ